MIDVLYRLGEYILQSRNIANEVGVIDVKDPTTNKVVDIIVADPIDKKEHVVLILFDSQGNYMGVRMEEFDTSNPYKYFFKKQSRNRYLTPTIPATAKNVLDSIINATKALYEASNLNLIKSIHDNLNRKQKTIRRKLNSKIKSIGSKKVLVTLKVDGKYLSDCSEFVYAAYKFFSGGSSRFEKSSSIGVCSMCGRSGILVSGDNSPYTFYTIDKPGYIVGGMRKELSWKNFPVCFDCRMRLEAAKNYVDKNLRFSFARGIMFRLIPHFYLFSNNPNDSNGESPVSKVLERLKGMERVFMDRGLKSYFLKEFSEMMEEIDPKQNLFLLDFVFLDEQQLSARQTIKLLLQDIFPSRLLEIYLCKIRVDGWILNLMNMKRDQNQYYINMDNLKRFFTSEYNGLSSSFPFEREFFKIVESIFKAVPFDEKSLIRIYMLSLRKLFNDPERVGTFYLLVLQSYFLYVFIKLCVEGGSLIDQFSNLDDFLNSLKGLEDNPVAKGIFLTGVLAQQVLDYQKNRVGTRAFSSKLGGLILNKTDVMRILSQARNKLYEYSEFNRDDRMVFEKASELLSSSDDWEMDTDEISYYFSLGLGMKETVYGFVSRLTEEERGVGRNLTSQFSDFDDFLSSLRGLGNSGVAKGIFLTGVLAQRVLDYQENKLKTRAFSSKLGGLVLNKRDVMRILSQVRNKLHEYSEFNRDDRIIFEKASELLSSSDDWKMDTNEISYYFSLGLGMKSRVYGFVFGLIREGRHVGGGNLTSQFSDFDDFLSSLRGLGNSGVARGIFLTGVLAQRVLDYQENKLKTRAFSSKLGGLILNKRDVMRILSQARNKLYEYGIFGKFSRKIFEKASELLSSSDKWEMDTDEISYYFSLGLGMKRIVYGLVSRLTEEGRGVGRNLTSQFSDFDDFLSSLRGLGNSGVARGIFLTGVLAQRVLDYQKRVLKTDAFSSKLGGLILNKRDVERILLQVRDKLRGYDEFKPVDRMIFRKARKLLLSSDDWKMNIDEISYYFSLGLGMKRIVYGFIFSLMKKENKEG